MASRTWTAILLSFLVWFAYMKWFAPPPPTATNQTQAPTGNPSADGKAPTSPAVTGSLASVALDKMSAQPSFRLADGELDLGFSESGGRMVEALSKRYHESTKAGSPAISVISPRTSPLSLSTIFSDATLASLVHGAYQQITLDKGVAYVGREGALEVRKEYRLDQASQYLDWKLILRVTGGNRVDWGTLTIPLGATAPHFDANDPLNTWEVVSLQADKTHRKHTNQLEDGEHVTQGATNWIAYGNRYFATAVVQQSRINPDVVLVKNASLTGIALRYPLLFKEGQKELEMNFRVFLGPKHESALGVVPSLRQLTDYGMFSFVAYPLLEVLRFFYRFTKNYGIAIILLTLLVRILFYPLSLKSYRSMKAMQKLQPQLTALKEKYADDKERFTQEQLALFKAHKVNPAGGCLPILIQLPVFIALYAVLQNSIELFQAPFFGWIRDLSAKDPLYVFPVLMGLAMVVQQIITPNVGMDQMQKRIMYLMPIVFTFFMISLPSGLTVYMFVSTLLGILQQYSMTRDPAKLEAKVVASGSSAPEKS